MEHFQEFKDNAPFPVSILSKMDTDLEHFACFTQEFSKTGSVYEKNAPETEHGRLNIKSTLII